MSLTIEVGSLSDAREAVSKIVAEVAATLDNPHYGQVLRNMIPVLERSESEYFRSATDPEGREWAKLAPSTVSKKGHGVILIDTVELHRSLTGEGGSQQIRDITDSGNKAWLTFGTSVEYAHFHMTGTRKMAARPHTGVNSADVETMSNMVADHLVRRMKGT